MLFIDGHCDTASELADRDKSLGKNDLCIDLERMPKGYTQVFAVFVTEPRDSKPMLRAEKIINNFKKEVDENNDKICLCTDNQQRLQALKDGKTAAFLSLEGGEAIEEIADADKLYDMGIRIASLSWNYQNQLAGGADSDGRLSELGKRTIEHFDKRGIILDVSHLNRKSFWDALEVSSKPVIATHSCSDAVCKHQRNLTDEQFKAICAKDGVVGINFYPKFLSDKEASIGDIVKHIDRFLDIGGENHIGLGSDFDGTDCLPDGICGVQDMYGLVEAFERHGYSQSLIEKLCYANFERILSML